jgi:hypothetical protein
VQGFRAVERFRPAGALQYVLTRFGYMSPRELQELLARIEDTREIVLGPAASRRPATGTVVELYAVWDAARTDARRAYDAWRSRPGPEGYCIYRAAADRADAAADVLAAAGGITPANSRRR